MAILDLISHVHLASFVIMLRKCLKYSTFSGCFWSIITCTGDGRLDILISLDFHTFISIPHLPISISLSLLSCCTVASLATSTRSSAYFTARITCPPILKPPKLSKPSRASLVRYSLYKLNRIGYKQHPCLIPLPLFTLLVSPWLSFSWTLSSKYNLLNLL